MIPATPTRESVTNVSDIASFSIATNAKAFRVLMSQLYTDKVTAAIRELWTNAYDAHVEAGCASTPFDVRLPTLLNPVFVVRDYGISMTDDQVRNLYTTFFSSSKETTNDQVGMLGLGSKAPLAYSDHFNIRVFMDGECRVYMVGLDEHEVPFLASVGAMPSDEPRGVEISFAVQLDDIERFTQTAKTIAGWFQPAPVINGVQPESPKPLASGALWEFYDKSAGSTITIRQGCVVYEIPYAITNNLRQRPIAPFRLVAPIGSIKVAASREQIEVDAANTAWITEAVKQANAEFLAAMLTAVEVIPDKYARCLKVDEFLTLAPLVKQYDAFKENIRAMMALASDFPNALGLKLEDVPHKRVPYSTQEKFEEQTAVAALPNALRRHRVFVVKDDGTKVIRGIKRLRSCRRTGLERHEGADRQVLVFDTSTPEGVDAANKTVAYFGIPATNVFNLADLPDPGQTARTKSKPAKAAEVLSAEEIASGQKTAARFTDQDLWFAILRDEAVTLSFSNATSTRPVAEHTITNKFYVRASSTSQRKGLAEEFSKFYPLLLGTDSPPVYAVTASKTAKLRPHRQASTVLAAALDAPANERLRTVATLWLSVKLLLPNLESGVVRAIVKADGASDAEIARAEALVNFMASHAQVAKIVLAVSKFDKPDYSAARAAKAAASLDAKYPLLFHSNTSHLLEYVAAANK